MRIPNKYNGYSADNRRLYNDPVTMAMVGAAAGAALKPNDPLKGAMLGATVGFTGGTALGVGAGTTRQATEAYTRGVQGIQSNAASAGRYGSNAMGQQVGQAQDVFGRNLAETAGQLAYQSAEAERGRQMQAVANAPAYAQADYQDIQKLLTAGQGQEQYQQKALQDAINRYNYEQTLPQQKLQQFTNLFTSAPGGGTSTTTQSGGK